ncbi:MAG: Uma2 family endonuclease [Polyangiales bacterium]
MPAAATQRQLAYAEYLAQEANAHEKHEYVDGISYAMSGGTPAHGRLTLNFARLLGNALIERPCVLLSSDVRIRIEAAHRSFYPDLSVVCHALEHASDDADAVCNPCLVVEVLSDSTEAYDRGEKFFFYRQLPSLQEYVLVSQHTPHVEIFRRRPDHWQLHEAHAGAQVQLTSLHVAFAVDDLYQDPLAPRDA